MGYSTATAYDGASALAIAAGFGPDVVLLDLAMPDLSGFEVARRLQALSTSSPMHLVALSGYGRTEDKIESYRVGFECHLLNPVDELTLKTALERYSPQTEPETTVKEKGTHLEAGVNLASAEGSSLHSRIPSGSTETSSVVLLSAARERAVPEG